MREQFLLRMTADIVLNSTFPKTELQRELEVIRQEAIEYEEDPQESSSDLLDRAIWGDHPMGMPVIGTVEQHRRFTRDDLVRHVRSHYVAGKTVVAAAGNFDVDAWLALAAEQLFAAMPAAPRARRAAGRAGAVRRPGAGAALQPGVAGVPEHGLSAGAARADEMPQQRWRLAASVAANLFGGGMSAPLVDTVRERLGLAYTAHSTMDSGDAWANFVVHAVTTPDKLEAAVTATGDAAARAGRRHRSGAPGAREEPAGGVARACLRAHLRHDGARRRGAPGQRLRDADAAGHRDDRGHRRRRGAAVFERMLAHPVALAITGKGASARSARQLAASLQ
jgi:predicted Zn-dependent peptidase